MTLVILSLHSHRGDMFVGMLFVLVIWLIGQAVWGILVRRPVQHIQPLIPSHRDERTIGDGAWKPDPRASSNTQARWPEAKPFASRANVRGEG